MEKEVIIRGVVMQEAIREKNQSLYRIKAGEKEYAVISEGVQAAKDHIFIRKGQGIKETGDVEKIMQKISEETAAFWEEPEWEVCIRRQLKSINKNMREKLDMN